MNKLIIFLIGCVALMQSTCVSASLLNDCLLEEDLLLKALLTNPICNKKIPQNRVIKNIQRVTTEPFGLVEIDLITARIDSCDRILSEKGAQEVFRATLLVTPNEEIGHANITVQSVEEWR